jgi:hypothetical protein
MPPSASVSFGLVAIERGETVGDRAAARVDGGVFLRARTGRAVLLNHRIEARLDGGVVGRGLQIGLIEGGVGGPRVQPQQRLAPAFFRRRADRAVARQLLQPRDTVAARHVAIGQMLRVGEGVTRIVGVVARELFETAARLIPALRRGRERLVVLELQFGRGRFAGQRALIFLHGARALTALREPPRVVHGLVAQARFTQAPAELIQIRIVRRDSLQARQVLLRARAVLAVGEHHAHAEQRIGLLGVDAQHLQPCLLGEVATLMRLPVLALIDQHVQRIFRRLRQRVGRNRRHAADRREAQRETQ